MTGVGRIWLGAVVCVMGFGVAQTQAIDPKYLPSDTEIVFTINLKQILASDVVKKNKDAVEQIKAMVENAIPAMLKKWTEGGGIEALRDGKK